jgi:hypothetical protein
MKYKVTVNVGGYWENHTTDLYKDEAEALRDHLSETFPDEDYLVEIDCSEPEVEHHYNEKAVDGWEDLFNYEE